MQLLPRQRTPRLPRERSRCSRAASLSWRSSCKPRRPLLMWTPTLRGVLQIKIKLKVNIKGVTHRQVAGRNDCR